MVLVFQDLARGTFKWRQKLDNFQSRCISATCSWKQSCRVEKVEIGGNSRSGRQWPMVKEEYLAQSTFKWRQLAPTSFQINLNILKLNCRKLYFCCFLHLWKISSALTLCIYPTLQWFLNLILDDSIELFTSFHVTVALGTHLLQRYKMK